MNMWIAQIRQHGLAVTLVLATIFFTIQAEVVTVFGLSNTVHAALVAHWTFDVNGADPTEDITGNGHNGRLGTVIGADSADPTYQCAPADIAPIAGNQCSLSFDGNNDRVVVTDNGTDPGLNPSGCIAIALWFKTTDTNGGMLVNKDGVSVDRQYDIHINADGGLATNYWSPSRAY